VIGGVEVFNERVGVFARIAVGMPFENELVIGGLDLSLAGAARHPENFVKVALHHRQVPSNFFKQIGTGRGAAGAENHRVTWLSL
jgi:hypothetical protein